MLSTISSWGKKENKAIDYFIWQSQTQKQWKLIFMITVIFYVGHSVNLISKLIIGNY